MFLAVGGREVSPGRAGGSKTGGAGRVTVRGLVNFHIIRWVDGGGLYLSVRP